MYRGTWRKRQTHLSLFFFCVYLILAQIKGGGAQCQQRFTFYYSCYKRSAFLNRRLLEYYGVLKVKCKFRPTKAMNAQTGSRGIVLLFL